jgi:hypothetical protein
MTSHEQRSARARDARERRAATKHAEEAWKARVDAHFGYLREVYGFAITQVDSSVWATRVIYATQQTEVGVTRSVEFSEADAWVQRQPDWMLPDQPVYTTMNLTHEQVSLGTLIRLRAPHLFPELGASIGLSDDEIEARLALCARVVREYGDDLLRGDCSRLGAQRATMYDDAPPRAPVLTLWVPETSEQGQRETWAEAVRRQSPGIRVITRTYRPRAPGFASKRQKGGSAEG